MSHHIQDRVLLICPVRNESRFIENLIVSIQRQTHTNWNIVFFDNFSSDNTVALIRKLGLTDSRVLVEEFEPSVPISASFNRAIEISISKYVSDFVGFIGGDDMILEDAYLEKLVEGLRCENSIAIPKHKIQEALEDNSYYATYYNLSRFSFVNRLMQAWDSNYGNIFYSLFIWEDFIRLVSDSRSELSTNMTTDWWFVNTALRVVRFPPVFVEGATYVKFNKRYGYDSEYYQAGLTGVKVIGIQPDPMVSDTPKNIVARVLIWVGNIVVVPSLIIFRERARIRRRDYPEFVLIWAIMVLSRISSATRGFLRKIIAGDRKR
jgi:glycosyltransferase involved in cell wall biosynthesis